MRFFSKNFYPKKSNNKLKFFPFFALFFVLTFLFVDSFVSNASAADIYYKPHSGNSLNSLNINSNQSPKNLYAIAQNIEVNSNVTKDAVVIGNNVTITGNIADDLIAAGLNLELNGSIGGSLRAAGYSINVNQPVGDDVVIASKHAHILANAKIGGDVIAVARYELQEDAPVSGNIYFAGEYLYVNNIVEGSIYAKGVKIELGPNADIKGSVTYSSGIVMDSGSKVEGQIQHKPSQSNSSRIGFIAYLLSFIFVLFLEFVGIFVLFAFFSQRVTNVVTKLNSSYWKNLLWGFLIALLMPIAATILLFTFIGIYLAALLVSVWLLLLLLGWAVGIVSFGTWLRSLLSRKPQQVTPAALALGIIVVSLIHLIPIAGFIFMLVISLAGIGAVGHNLWFEAKMPRISGGDTETLNDQQ